jgi:hypothetical protein
LFRRACLAKNVPLSDAAALMGIDIATLSRGIHGLGPLDFNRLIACPDKVLRRFFRLVLAAKLKQWELEAPDEQRRA